MNPTLRNILAVIAGLIIGGVANMGIIMVSSSVIPAPEGVDPTSVESVKESIHLYSPKHFLFPFVAHALGTLIGAFITAAIAFDRRKLLAMITGTVFLIAGIINAFMLPAPGWFIAVDLILAYLPMAWIGWRIRG